MGVEFQRIEETAHFRRHELAGGQQRMHRQGLADMIGQQPYKRTSLNRRAGKAGGDPQDAMAGERGLQPDMGIRAYGAGPK